MKKYELIKIIGDGTYGVVYEGINKETKQKVAVKKLKDRFSSLEECLNKIEVKVLEKLNHENIVQLKEVIRDKKGEVSYIFEYCDCNLFEFIENHHEHKKSIPEPIIREIVFQITKGIKYMHSKNFFHRDLKPENILVILNNYNLNNIIPGEIKIKICDFGTAKEISFKNILPMTDYVCTRWYRSPECILRADNYDEKMDVWAIGCIMAELYKLSAIFPGENEFDQLNQILKILGTPTRTKWPWGYYQSELFGIQLPIYYKKDFKNILGYICKDGINLLNEIFTFDPLNRPSCSKILNHPYFKVIPKPKININININNMIKNSNNLKLSNRKNNFQNYKTENNYSFSQSKNINKNNRANNNSANRNIYIENKECYDINKNNINKSNNININNTTKKNVSKKNSSSNINTNNCLNNSIKTKINTNDSNNNAIKTINKSNNINKNLNMNYLSTTEKKKKNSGKYIKINETKSGIVTKKILRYKKNKEDNTINNNNDKNEENKKQLIIRRIERIGRNGENNNIIINFNNRKDFSFALNSKKEEKENLRDKSIEVLSNIRNTVTSNKNKLINIIEERKQINDLKNHKIIDIVYNNNHKDHYIRYDKANGDRTSINRSNTKTNNLRKNYERNSETNNNKIIMRTKNLNYHYHNNKSIYRDNHKFYVSIGNKNSNLSNQRHIIRNSYYTFDENNNNHNNICICSLGRNYSTKKNLVNNNKDYRHSFKKSYNLRNLEDNYRNNKTPKNKNNNINNLRNNPQKKDDKISSLYSYFRNSKNNVKYYEKSQSLFKNNNSTVDINFHTTYRKINFNNNKRKVKNMNEASKDNTINNYKDYKRNTKN